jgi:diguanylate cyclase (GGDEF)-like protein/PAS domain S-box-containing protein
VGLMRAVSFIEILIGAAVMLLSIVAALDIRKKAARYLRRRWLIITVFAFLFLLGYIFVIFISLFHLSFPLEILIGSVFLGGSLFVNIVVRTTSRTLSDIGEKEKEILTYSEKMEAANSELRETNESLEMEIAEHRRSETALKKSEEKYRSLVESTDDSIYVIDKGHRYLFINKKHRGRLGISDTDYIGKTYGDFHSPGITMGFKKIVEEVFARGESMRLEHLSERDNEHYLLTLSPVRESDGKISAVTVVSKRVTELKRMEQELRDLSLTDELTGLYNRRGFFTLAEQQTRMAKRNKNMVFILYADMDNLKVINDTFGHREGDMALVDTAKILKESFRDSDIIARIGGDEFVVMPIGASEMEAKITVERLFRQTEIANRARNRNFRLSLSVGITHYDPEHPATIADLLVFGDTAMYEDKKGKKSRNE